jgi:hypothetical protein
MDYAEMGTGQIPTQIFGEHVIKTEPTFLHVGSNNIE